jgi:hypothetical protein
MERKEKSIHLITLPKMTTSLLARADRSGRSNSGALGKRGAKRNDFGGRSIAQLELGLGRGRQGDCVGDQTRKDRRRRQRRGSSRGSKYRLGSGDCLRENSRGGIDWSIAGDRDYGSIRSASFKWGGSFAGLLSTLLLSRIDASASPFDIDSTVGLAHEAV